MVELNSYSSVFDLRDAIVVEVLQELLYSLNTNYECDEDLEVADSCRVLIEYFGTPEKDFSYES